jgi:hypothetical protein
MIAYKFLRSGRIGPFSGYRWPEPGVWVEADRGDPLTCRAGVHACRVEDLPWWLTDELWEVELEDRQVRVAEHKIVARAGRLRTRIDRWTEACARDYAEACAWRARDCAVEALRRIGSTPQAAMLAGSASLVEVREAARRLAEDLADARIAVLIAADGADCAVSGSAPTSAYVAAHAAYRLDGAAGYAAERAMQSSWLIERLGLRA